MTRLLLASIAMILIVVIGVRDIAIPTLQAYDPPSIYNADGGGYSSLEYILRSLGYRVGSTEDLRSLENHNPGSWVLIIASPDRELSQIDIAILAKWVSSGGRVVALDEVGTLSPLLRLANASLTQLIRSTGVAQCNAGGRIYSVLYNIYSGIAFSPEEGVEILCTLHSYSVAIRAKILSGELIFISDSSVVINSVLTSRFGRGNLEFFLDLLGGRHVIFYEGGREMIIFRSSYILLALMIIPAILSYASTQILSTGLLGVLIILFISILATAMSIGRVVEPPKIRKGSPRSSVNIDIANIFVKGAERWRRLRGRG